MTRGRSADAGRLYIFAWRNNAVRLRLFGRSCRVIARGSMNSALVEFVDTGERHVISCNALRRSGNA